MVLYHLTFFVISLSGRQFLLHLSLRLPKLPGIFMKFHHCFESGNMASWILKDLSAFCSMMVGQGGQGCFDIDECTLSEGVS